MPGLEEFGVLILGNMLKGLVIGLAAGAVIGGISGYAQYGVKGILSGVLNGAIDGALMGAAFGGLTGFGAIAGTTLGCSTVMNGIFAVSGKLSLGMLEFDLLALTNDFQVRFQHDTGINLGLINPVMGSFISYLNHEAHSNPYYNAFQLVTGGLASFSYGYVDNAACFIAGTLIATLNGYKAIENIKEGDVVLAADEETMQVGYKQVLETYVRKVHNLVYLMVNGEQIVATVDHPFFVQGRGFIEAGKLFIGDKLVNANGEDLVVDEIKIEQNDETVNVYNFKVEDYHTYFVGEQKILVHNRGYENFEDMPRTGKPGSRTWKDAVKSLKEGNLKGKGNNYVTETKADALRLIEEARPDLPKQPTYQENGPRAKYYQEHPIERDVNFNRPHIKFEDWSHGKSGGEGHIFWEND
ncbi:MAG: HINT domain-containing protein [Ruminococcus sp.]|uniref:polymorphic toxin-type HINT domain-containing protein n=1 Tax=Ruminococcus sp. TaxID=41978 RepID=UPI0025FD4937|nr:polymorphic toxin-type HINT domain-containing protein [Ruminococcus sp.]MCR5599338.1 HINT domain-containing protein [Ruminococcus sp.]